MLPSLARSLIRWHSLSRRNAQSFQLLIEIELLEMVNLGILLLLLRVCWWCQRVWMTYPGSESGACTGHRALPDRLRFSPEANRNCVGLPLDHLLPSGINVVETFCANSAQIAVSTQWNDESARTRRGLDLCRCARNYEERFSSCLYQGML